jgi:hypothetical protein
MCWGGVADGDWVDDKRHGWGKMTFVRGLQYEGEWAQDKTEGFGVCVYENGDQYSGDWLNDHRWGCVPLHSRPRVVPGIRPCGYRTTRLFKRRRLFCWGFLETPSTIPDSQLSAI